MAVTWFVGLASLQTSVIHGIFCFALIVFPIATLYFLLKNRERLPDRKNILKYGTLYQGIKTDKKSTVIYNGIFILRRMFLVCLIVFMYDYPFFKPMIFLWSQVFYVIWAGWTKPHDDRWYNFLERLNETGLTCIGYILFIQTAFIED